MMAEEHRGRVKHSKLNDLFLITLSVFFCYLTSLDIAFPLPILVATRTTRPLRLRRYIGPHTTMVIIIVAAVAGRGSLRHSSFSSPKIQNRIQNISDTNSHMNLYRRKAGAIFSFWSHFARLLVAPAFWRDSGASPSWTGV